MGPPTLRGPQQESAKETRKDRPVRQVGKEEPVVAGGSEQYVWLKSLG